MLHEAYCKNQMTTIPFPVRIGNADMYVLVPVTKDELKILTDIAKKIAVNGEEIEPFCKNPVLSVLYNKVMDSALADVSNADTYGVLQELGIPLSDGNRCFIKNHYAVFVDYPYLEHIKSSEANH